VWKLNADGTNAWVRTTARAESYSDIWSLGIAADGNGNIYTTGSFDGAAVDFSFGPPLPGQPAPVVPLPGQQLSSALGNADTFIDKMDTTGKWLWVRQAVSAGENRGTGIALDAAGNAFVTGHVTAKTEFGPFVLAPASPRGNSFIAELDKLGNFVAAQKAKDIAGASDRSAATAVDGQGFVDITGAYTARMQWPALPLLGSVADSADILVIKTKLPTRHIPQVVGTTLQIVGDPVNPIVITDDRNWGPLVTIGDTTLAYKGLSRIEISSPNDNRPVRVSLAGPDATGAPSSLRTAFSARLVGGDTLDISALSTLNWSADLAHNGPGGKVTHQKKAVPLHFLQM
jgi:hypothetical protein